MDSRPRQKLLCVSLGLAAGVVACWATYAVILRPPESGHGLPVQTVIKVVDAQGKLAVLARGLGRNVEKGQRFFVHRGGDLFGILDVTEVQDDVAVATILANRVGDPIRPGDRASTQP